MGDKAFCKSMGGSFDKDSACREGKCMLRECSSRKKNTSVMQVVQCNVNSLGNGLLSGVQHWCLLLTYWALIQ